MKHAIATAVLLLCACGQPAEQAAPSDVAAAATATTEFPDLLPDYPGSKRVEVANLGVNGTDSRSGRSIAMETSATPTDVAQFYRDWFTENGVPIRHDTMTAQGGLISAGKDGGQGVMLTISGFPGKTRIGVVRGPGR